MIKVRTQSASVQERLKLQTVPVVKPVNKLRVTETTRNSF